MFKKKILSLIVLFISSVFARNAIATTEEALFLENVAKQYILAQFTEKNDNIRYNVKVSKVDRNRDFGGCKKDRRIHQESAAGRYNERPNQHERTD